MKKSQPTTTKTSTKKLPSQQAQPKQPQSQPDQRKGTAPTKQQNIKQFKVHSISKVQVEIDHEIAKCLDTLNRQGLKYLKETLRNSNVFNEEIKEVILVDKSKEKRVVSRSPLKNKKHDQIQEEIMEEYDTFMDDHQEPSKQKTKLGPNPTHPLKQQKLVPLKLQKFQDKIQQPLKPFAIRSGSRQGSRVMAEQVKPVDKRVVQKDPAEQEIIDKRQIDQIVQKISHLPEEKLKKVGKFIEILEKSQRLEEQEFLSLKQTRPYLFKPDQPQAQMSNPSNMMKSSTVNKSKKNEKATSLYSSIIKGSKKNSPIAQKQQNQPHYSEHDQETFHYDNEISEEIPDVEEEDRPNHPKFMEIPDQMIRQECQGLGEKVGETQRKVQEKFNQSILGKRNQSSLIKKGSFIKNFPISQAKKPLDIEVTESHQADTLQMNLANNSKMVRLGKKKLGTNKVKIVLLRNRGHPSIIGLTGIEFYNTNGRLIPILLQNMKSQSPKLLKLFNGIHQTVNQQQMFTTVFKRDYQIQLQIPQKIGGMRIWNYNKSQIQSEKETDWIELYINDRLSWEGLIKKGSYNQLIDYCTEAVVQPGFDFGMVKKDSGNQRKIEELSQAPSSSDNIKIQGAGANGMSAGKKSERDNKKIDWLQNTLIQDKIKKIIQEDQKIEQIQAKKPIFKASRLNQIQQQQQKLPGKLTQSKQKFLSVNNHKKQESLTKNIGIESHRAQKLPSNPPIQRTSRSTSQKIEQQKDIFSTFGQTLIKQKMKAVQLNNKVNQMSQKIDKLKETYRKDAEFGYSSLITKEEVVQQKPIPKIEIKEKKSIQKQSLDDFMNDSLFQDPVPRNEKKPRQVQPFNPQRAENQTALQRNFNKKMQSQQKPKNEKVDIDDFLNELNDLVGSKQNKNRYNTGKQGNIIIPQLPKGIKLDIMLLSNWGDQQSIGMNKIEFFDQQGLRVFPTEAKSNVSGSSVTSIFSQSTGYIAELTSQWKINKKDYQIKIEISFSKKVEISLIRVWNYVGDRVHSMVGVRKIQIALDGSLIFLGDIRKNAGSSRDQIFKSCQNILFTNNPQIQKKIIQNDWLTQQLQNQRQEAVIFKKTIQNFMRPQTNCITTQKQIKMVQNKEGIKLPKRNCFEYDPPSLPSGHYLKFILHTTWGDRDFIGLNSIVVYNEKGEQLTPDIKKISQFPAPLITLAGYQKDKRVLNNLFDGRNLTSNDESIWLAPYLQDIDKMEKQAQNAILIQFDKCCTFSGVNMYNYTKTPKRGVRQIEIHVDNYLIYRGYLRMANIETGEILTTINFTKDPILLEKIGYVGYHEDNLGQDVVFYNQGKIQKPIF